MDNKIASIMTALTPQEKEELKQAIEREQMGKMTREQIRELAKKMIRQ